MGTVKKMTFKKHDICLMIAAVVRDSGALDFITVRNKTKWGHAFQRDEEDKAVEVTLLFERLYIANHIARHYDERHGIDSATTGVDSGSADFSVPLFSIRDLLSSKEWRQLEDLELLEMLVRLRESVFSPTGVICLASDADLRQLELLLLYYYDKVLLTTLGGEGRP